MSGYFFAKMEREVSDRLKNKSPAKFAGLLLNALEWIRTTDLRLRRPTLYPAELRVRTGAKFSN